MAKNDFYICSMIVRLDSGLNSRFVHGINKPQSQRRMQNFKEHTPGNSFTKFLRNLPSDLKCDITSHSCKGRIKIQLSRLRTFSRSSSHYVRVIYIQKPETSSIDVGNVCVFVCLYVCTYVYMYVCKCVCVCVCTRTRLNAITLALTAPFTNRANGRKKLFFTKLNTQKVFPTTSTY
jgi:hypothetical protein